LEYISYLDFEKAYDSVFIAYIIRFGNHINGPSIYIPLHKKGARDWCKNYRTISLIRVSKIMLYII